MESSVLSLVSLAHISFFGDASVRAAAENMGSLLNFLAPQSQTPARSPRVLHHVSALGDAIRAALMLRYNDRTVG